MPGRITSIERTVRTSRRLSIQMALATLILLGLIAAAWLGYVARLASYEDKACGSSSHMTEQTELQRVLDEYSGNRIVGLEASVVFPDGVAWNAAAGQASLEKQCPMTLDHHLYIGSMTKLFTAALVMKQLEQGRLSLDDTLDKWIAWPHAKNVTVELLLNHTRGIPNYTQDAWFLARYLGLPAKRWQPDELVRVLDGKQLRFAPGTRHEYSNSNYVLLGAILEKLTGRAYGELLRAEILDRLGLRDTFYLDYPEDIAIANAYDESLLRLGRRNLTGQRKSFETGAYAAGGLLSTSNDVARLVHALFTGQIVSEPSLAQMKTFVAAPDADMPEQTGYGLGIRRLMIGGEVFVGHTGSIPGYSGIAMHNEQRRYSIVILSNLSVIEQMQLMAEVQAAINRGRE